MVSEHDASEQLTKNTKKKKRKGCLFGCMTLLILSSMVVFFIVFSQAKMGRKKKQYEAQTNLKALFVAQVEYSDKFGHFAQSFKDLPWEPEGGFAVGNSLIGEYFAGGPDGYHRMVEHRYHYAMGSAHLDSTYGEDVGEICGNGPFSMPSGASPQNFIAHASANIDADPYVDGWQINDQGMIVNICDDIQKK